MPTLKGKVALITGGSRGISRAVANRLRTAGAAVAINYRSRPEDAQEAVRLVGAAGGVAQAFQADVAELYAIRALYDDVEAGFAEVNIVVANPEIPFIGVPVVDVTEADFSRPPHLETTPPY